MSLITELMSPEIRSLATSRMKALVYHGDTFGNAAKEGALKVILRNQS